MLGAARRFIQNRISEYFGMVKCIDDNVGRILDYLEAEGLDKNTIVVFTSDHGDLMGEHGRVNKGVPYEASAKVPFLLRYPGKVKPGKQIEKAYTLADFTIPLYLGLWAWIILLFLQCKQQEELPKPNILWITIEDTSPQFIGCYGDKNARTPVIDRLAGEGVRFTNAFATGTVCSPSRTAIITGVKTYKAGTGNHRSKYPVPEFIKGFPYYLQEKGITPQTM
jgi:arylsulfatase A-like enzyme